MKVKRIDVHLICCYCVQSKPKMALSSVKYSLASSINFKYFEIRISLMRIVRLKLKIDHHMSLRMQRVFPFGVKYACCGET